MTTAAATGAALSGPPPPLLGFGTYNKLRDHEAMAAGVRYDSQYIRPEITATRGPVSR